MRTRFAPSPTGPLHLGHAYSAMLASDIARAAGGAFLLRIEDIDQSRARPQWESQIFDDLHWLGLDWPRPVMRQSERMDSYRDALEDLWSQGLLYPCTCKRRDILEAANAPQEGGAPPVGPDGIVYPGTCRRTARTGPLPSETALRLDMSLAMHGIDFVSFTETGVAQNGETGAVRIPAKDILTGIGDIVVARREMGTSYHLAVVIDDAAQGITDVIRGQDLFEATAIHVVLQRLLALPTPTYHHHRLVRDDDGKRLAKRDDARAIGRYRADGLTPDDIREKVGLA
ncbi:glutamyl-Q tRNA(Asp) synthetase [Aliiruegeria haliotis]|uniref:Glutamyl-Q tRNA(Asp) synthetase n=1 Tax=Aliiruegeria haliotis TaxID=1280846 RepID=A0A2T0RZR1_9RHOB|nr:tRNA glutamyl-Q(34) synthetase GluQRS [Aliiruegeria haliotis]PRY26664.1 glutamyl-Q tRNA(Asp) synthetase [Aliiruegeria haliotis]